jgi:hypothetical protein
VYAQAAPNAGTSPESVIADPALVVLDDFGGATKSIR